MIIEKIKIHNFGPFHGEHEIQFPGNGAGVHLIRGNNGQGKTSIQRAILWCLYGNVTDRKGKEIPPTSLINHIARDDDIYQFYVRLFFNHEGVQWSIFRKMEANKHNDNKYRDGMNVDVTRDGAVEPNPNQVIERILPPDVHRYFFFDGEMLRDYEELLDESSPRMSILRDAIEHILGVPYFRNARNDTASVRKKLEAERTKLIKKLGGKELEELASAIQFISEEIQSREDEIKRSDADLEAFKIDISDKMRELADLKEVKELGERRLELVAGIERLKRQRQTQLNEMQALTNKLYKMILSDTAKGLLRQLELKHEASTKKYAEKQQLIGRTIEIKKGIKSSQCSYCGTILNAEKLNDLKKLLKEAEDRIKELTQIPEPNHEFEDSKNVLERMLLEDINRDKFVEYQTLISSIDHDIATKDAEKMQIEEKLGDPAQVEIARTLERTIQNMVKEQGRMEQKILNIKDRLIEDYATKGEFERQISSIPQDELNELSKRIKILVSLERVFEEAVSEYRSEKRLEVESNASDIFRKLRSNEDYDKLKINDQFGLSIITRNKKVLDKSEWRSSGEEQLVALSLIGALNRCAQIKAPVLMDTPFGRLDVTHGERVLSYLPNLSEQVILLVTDREFRSGDERFLGGKIKSDLTVISKGEKVGSQILATRSCNGEKPQILPSGGEEDEDSRILAAKGGEE